MSYQKTPWNSLELFSTLWNLLEVTILFRIWFRSSKLFLVTTKLLKIPKTYKKSNKSWLSCRVLQLYKSFWFLHHSLFIYSFLFRLGTIPTYHQNKTHKSFFFTISLLKHEVFNAITIVSHAIHWMIKHILIVPFS